VTTRNITRRLERLEEETKPVGEPMIIQVVYVSTDGTRKDGPQYEIPVYPAGRSRYGWPR
jgi:hypothetical protein